ncbi:MAG TPA: oligosaccharide flippase family protein [Vicinamibacterales bacterium]
MLRNIGSNWVLTVLTVAVSYVMTPFVVRTFGESGYGTWTLVNAMTGYLGLVALGVPMACLRYVAQHVSLGEWTKANQTIGTCAALYLMLGVGALLIGGGLWWAFTFYDIPPSFRGDAYVAFGLMVFYIAFSFVSYLPEGIMYAHHDFVPRNLVRIAGLFLRFGLTIGFLGQHPSLTFLAAIQLVGLAFDFFLSVILIRILFTNIRIDLRLFDRATLRRVLGFSLFVLLLAAGGRMSFETDALVIGALIGVAPIASYAFANSLVVYVLDFVVGIAAVVSPMATALSSQARGDELREMFLKWSKASLSLAIAVGLFLLVLGPRFIGLWIGAEQEGPSGAVLQVLTLSCFIFLPARGVALPILMGLGKARLPAVAFLIAGVVNLLLSAALARPLGLVGVAIGTAVPNAVFAGVLIAATCRELKLTMLDYTRYVVPRAALGGVPIFALLVWFKVVLGVDGFAGLVAAGIAFVLAFGIIWVLFVYRDDPYVDIRSPLLRLRVWSRA